MAALTSSRPRSSTGFQFEEFCFHAEFEESAAKPQVRSRLFSSREVFEARLRRWSRQGWRYYETAADRVVNERCRSKVLCYPATVIRGETEHAITGFAEHHSVLVIRADRARKMAAALGVREEDAGDYDASANW